ncbi:SGNH/GDSL hydrolase family protein [Frigidibacter sp. ROC022]|uniref:SGNH/GDSL hydrolase family protein n=1 Tax=Frigidibacter sp. ROC022 TaxID=2971796 RepID=UPI00215A82DB|nr:SGNH/GDSL hydrolase family protein [Frigidibacter sp. ROC022]MCR8723041.1 SGNH/GDSL hydrolase family protein [Frigidibacter sp. ROC022]
MPLLLTFGDSNTYGTLPIRVEGEPGRRLPPDERWPGVCLAALGDAWSLVEEGLPGRTLAHPDPVMGPHMDGRVGLMIALQSHGPIDALTLMLGTNDMKRVFDVSPEQVAADAGVLLDICLSDEMQERHGGFDVLLICPPPVLEQGALEVKFRGGHAKSLALPELYRAEAESRGLAFLDAGTLIESSAIDGVHFEAPEHRKLGRAVADLLRDPGE